MALSAPEFDWVCELVRRESAIVLEPGKEYLAESRLQSLARKQGLGSVSELLSQMRSGRLTALQPEVVDAMTTNETSFFRDTHPWETLRTELVPQLLEQRRAERTLTVWCAACSSGQEPYSLALLLQEHFAAELTGWTVRIIATDISPSMLERTRAAKYSQLEVNRGLPAAMMLRWFTRAGVDWQIAPEVRSMVEVRAVNLAEQRTWAGLPRFDLVFIRNVLIYFDADMKAQILNAVHDQLRDGGALFLGSSETTIGLVDCFAKEQSGKTIYYRRK